MAYASTANKRTVVSSPSNAEDTAKLLLRVVFGVLILLHGIAKIGSGPEQIIGLVTKADLPGAIGYLVYIGEVVAPLLLIVGVWTRVAALIVVINMVVAVLLAHTGQMFSISKSGGWALELQAAYLLIAIVITLLGAGRFSLGGTNGRWN